MMKTEGNSKTTLFQLRLKRVGGQLHLSLHLPWPWFLGLIALLATPEAAQLFNLASSALTRP